ncbi:MAG: hypothetical protein MJZ23_04885 [Paludibacteraceae bacterium]|nr:hypothetical protein [Paludibacteraceae bacterium]
MMSKTYQLSRLYSLVMPVVTPSGTTIVEFKGVQNMNMHGLYTTQNADVQNALEASAEFRQNVFRLVSTTGGDEQKPSATKGNRKPATNTSNLFD